MKIQIDFREKSILQYFDNQETDCNVEQCSLPVGDFVIRDEITDQLYCIIERKTIDDLSASIKDGRFREQKTRLLESTGDPQRVIYIIEGYTNNFNKRLLPKDTLDSAIMNLSFKHNYKVLYTFSSEDTFYKLKKLYKKIKDKEFFGESTPGNKTNLISKTQKMSNNIFVNQLCVIPGVSKSIADSIVLKYPTIKDVIESYNLCKEEKEREMMLVNIEINSKRKIGKVLSKKIYTALTVKQ